MENMYIKQFPDIMSGKKVLYFHGFLSSGQSGTVKLLQQLMPSADIEARDIPVHPDEALTMLNEWVEESKPQLIIGTSMGGMYAERMRGVARVLVNPAFQMGDTMSSMTGKQQFQNPRSDGENELMVTKGLIKEYRDFCEHCFEGVTPDDAELVWGLFGDHDPVVHTFDLFCQHYHQAVPFHGEHRLVDKVALHYLLPVIRWIDDKQEGRERPIVYIHYDTLHDAYNHPTSSMHKAFEMLIENYQVYIVAPAPSNNKDYCKQVQQWCEENLSAPSWNHVIFTCWPQLLYGDYLIGKQLPEAFMGTGIAYGSDEFKTWDDIITYFERLGGQ